MAAVQGLQERCSSSWLDTEPVMAGCWGGCQCGNANEGARRARGAALVNQQLELACLHLCGWVLHLQQFQDGGAIICDGDVADVVHQHL